MPCVVLLRARLRSAKGISMLGNGRVGVDGLGYKF